MTAYLNRKGRDMRSTPTRPMPPRLVLPTIALTIQQPWASFFFITPAFCEQIEMPGRKDIENRSWKPASVLKPGDRLWIHAGKTLDKDAFDDFDLDPDTCKRRGMLLGHCRFDGVVTKSDSKWRNEQPFGWVLVDPVRTPDVACNGAQGLWWPRQDTLEAMRQAIEVRDAREKLGLAERGVGHG